MSVWQRFWTIWALFLIVVLLTFLVGEAIALKNPATGDTLSESVWQLRESGSWVYWLIVDAVVVTGLTMAWLLFHFRHQSGRVIP